MEAIKQHGSLPYPFTILKALGLPSDGTAALRPWRVKRGCECPVCGKASECLVVPDEGSQHVWCTRQDGGVEIPNFGFKQTLHYHALAGGKAVAPRPVAQPDAPLAPVAKQDVALRAIARFFGLSEDHRAQLVKRGYRPEDVGPAARFLFASLPADAYSRAAAVNAVLQHAASVQPNDLQGVLGVGRDRRSGPDAPLAFLPNCLGPALVEFVVDADGLVVGFEYAPDSGLPAKRLSPSRLPKAGMYHVASGTGDQIWHTEGVHKADLTSDRLGVTATGCLGAGNTAGVLAAAAALDPTQARLHVLALDTDQHGGKLETQAVNRLLALGYRVALARWEGGKGPDDQLVAGGAMRVEPVAPPKGGRVLAKTVASYAWQASQETPAERASKLQRIGNQIAQDVQAGWRDGGVTVIAAPPGLGKSHWVAELGRETNVAWIAERHAMTNAVPALREYRHILAPGEHNCASPDLHHTLGRKGYQTGKVHRRHRQGECEYVKQFQETGSAVYQLGHVQTRYPGEHDAIVIDELALAVWQLERVVTTGAVAKALATAPVGSAKERFLAALRLVLLEVETLAARGGDFPTGADLVALLDRQCGGELATLLEAAKADPDFAVERPDGGVDGSEPDALAQAQRLPTVGLPFLVAALCDELPKWQTGGYNSVLRSGPHGEGVALFVTAPRRFGRRKDGTLPPVCLLDATADQDVLERLFGQPVTVTRTHVDPPAGTRHIACRAARYSKTALASRHGRDLQRVAKQAKYLLRECQGTVGLVTFQEVEQEIGDALGIPAERRLHFWATRGSNNLANVDVLLVIGTPRLPAEEVIRLGRALYKNEAALDETVARLDDGTAVFRDPRLERLNAYLVESELTQAAHRSRALRFDNRTVITFCAGEIGGLPATETITAFPGLGDEGATKAEVQDERLATAAQAIAARGEAVTVKALKTESGLRTDTVAAWLRENKLHVHLSGVPTSAYKDTICAFGYAQKLDKTTELDGAFSALEQNQRTGAEIAQGETVMEANELTTEIMAAAILTWAKSNEWKARRLLPHILVGGNERLWRTFAGERLNVELIAAAYQMLSPQVA